MQCSKKKKKILKKKHNAKEYEAPDSKTSYKDTKTR